MWQRKLIRFLLLPIGITGFLVIILVVPLNYTPDTSVPLPYIPPPEGDEGYYMATTVDVITSSFTAAYAGPFQAEDYKGQSFIFKNVQIPTKGFVTKRIETYIQGKGLVGWETETYVMVGLIKFVPRDPSDLKDIKVGDVIDIIGVCDGLAEGWLTVVVITNCQFFPAGVAPLPLPGGPAPSTGY